MIDMDRLEKIGQRMAKGDFAYLGETGVDAEITWLYEVAHGLIGEVNRSAELLSKEQAESDRRGAELDKAWAELADAQQRIPMEALAARACAPLLETLSVHPLGVPILQEVRLTGLRGRVGPERFEVQAVVVFEVSAPGDQPGIEAPQVPSVSDERHRPEPLGSRLFRFLHKPIRRAKPRL